MPKKYDFSGYATKNDLKCSDGRTIRQDAFKDNDGTIVPLVWQHLHDEPINVLGHALLENREDGVYAYCALNDSEQGKHMRTLVEHGDITSMSIYANRLVQKGSDVVHGVIREVSLVLAGANPGARIENISLEHSDGMIESIEDEACIYSDDPISIKGGMFEHADEAEEIEEVVEHAEEIEEVEETSEEIEHADDENQNGSDSEETVAEIIDSMTDKQKDAMYYVVSEAVDEVKQEMSQSDDEGESFMKHNVFEGEAAETAAIAHAEINGLLEKARKSKAVSLREVFAESDIDVEALSHGIEQIDVLYPEAKLVTPTPELITRPMGWVPEVWNRVKKSPFARIKSIAADITADEARARGYIKGKKKEEEVFSLLKRATDPQTIYKLQKIDRDDVIDITDIDIVAWVKREMRMMLDEEISRAILVGDGRQVSADNHIKHEHIRPIYHDDDLYTIKYKVDTDSEDLTDRANAFIDATVDARAEYMGSGNPVMFASTKQINSLLLAKDKMGHRLYANKRDLADAMLVSQIIEVPVLEGQKRHVDANFYGDSQPAKDYELLALIVDLNDYTVGTDRGGEVNLFDDFDIDYNKYEYLIETRLSGALTKPYSAIALEKDVTALG